MTTFGLFGLFSSLCRHFEVIGGHVMNLYNKNKDTIFWGYSLVF